VQQLDAGEKHVHIEMSNAARHGRGRRKQAGSLRNLQ
jgi:hypothetical protein